MRKKAIFLYDRTGLMAVDWLAAGYQCWLYDGQHPDGVQYHPPGENGGQLVTVGRYFYPDQIEQHALQIGCEVLADGGTVELVFGFPECTDLTVAGNRSAKDKIRENPAYLENAKQLCMLVPEVAKYCRQLGGAAVPWALENPKWNRLTKLWQRFNHTFDPCDYAGYLPDDDEHPLYPEIIPARDRYNKGTAIWCGNGFVMPAKKRIEPPAKESPMWVKLGGRSLRTKNIRSATPRGFAKAAFIHNVR